MSLQKSGGSAEWARVDTVYTLSIPASSNGTQEIKPAAGEIWVVRIDTMSADGSGTNITRIDLYYKDSTNWQTISAVDTETGAFSKCHYPVEVANGGCITLSEYLYLKVYMENKNVGAAKDLYVRVAGYKSSSGMV